jgi:UDP-N-acetylmuramate--alanine ligase
LVRGWARQSLPQFLDAFAEALSEADCVLIAPLYSAGEAPIPGISSAAMADAVRERAPQLPVQVAGSLEELAALVASASREGDLVLAMGAGDVNSLWDRLGQWQSGADSSTAATVATDTALAA